MFEVNSETMVLSHLLIGREHQYHNSTGRLTHTVFDLISVLFAYVILGQKNRPNFYYLKKKSFMYFVCVYPGCKTLLPEVVACEGPLIMITGSLSLKKKKIIKKKLKKEEKKGVFAN